jgi:putative methionine-R-sulfoxide reductase with GAF domain
MKNVFWKNWPLATKLTATITSVLVIVVVGISILYTRRLEQSLRVSLENQAGLALETLAVTAVNPILTEDVETLQDYAEDLGQQPLVLSVRIDNSDGLVLADAHDPNSVLHQNTDVVGQKALGSDAIILEWQSDRLVAAKGVIIGNQRPGAVSIELSTQVIDQELANARTVSFLIVLVAILTGAIAATLFIRNVTGPLQTLLKATKQIGMGDFSAQANLASEDEIGQIAGAFNYMATELKALFETLEQRIAERTKALKTSTEVGRRLSTILDQRQLIIEVVEQVRNAFNYYHVHIYLVDEHTGDLIMAGGTGKAGQTMLENHHKVSRGKGLVGLAAEANQPVLVADVSSDPNWLPNPLLPETKSEVAVPIFAAGSVLGVLDVQHNITGGLRQEDVELLQSIVNQVAIAIQNTRAFEQAQHQAEKETLINTISEKIQRATTIEAVLQVAARELSQMTGAKRASVQLGMLQPVPKSVDHSDSHPQN